MNKRLEKQLKFIIEIDRVKSIIRKTKIFHQNRYENDAEHSWHISLMAIILCEHSNEPIDILKVIKMLLIHDLVEIDAGDTIVYKKSSENVIKEKKAAERIFGLLPPDQNKEFLNLWLEFEKFNTTEAKFATALDRTEPVMQNTHHNCDTWNSHNITYNQVININTKISNGSKVLWDYLKEEIDKCYNDGLFKK